MKNNNSGQALVILLVYMVVAIIITTVAVALIIINATAASQVEQGDTALMIAESGAENALIRLVRTPDYTGETLTVGGGSATVTVSGMDSKTIISQGTSGDITRTIRVEVGFVDDILTLYSWKEQ